MIVRRATVALALIVICASVESAAAQIPDPELELCRSTGLAALRQLNPAIKDVSLDIEGMTAISHVGSPRPSLDDLTGIEA
jgi:hypothetical protein